ncbi:MAG: class I SAM-dependent methyltransferase [Nanoarchaeota archaeon]
MSTNEIVKRCPSLGLKLYTYLRFLILPVKKIDEIVPKSGIITDYGCGFGIVSCYLGLSSKNRKITGIEYNAERIKKARLIGKNIKNVKFEVRDASKIRISKSEVHLLIDVMHHIPYNDQISLLNNIFKSIRKNDLIIIKDIDKKPFLKYLWNYTHDKIMTINDRLYFRNQEWFESFFKERKMKTEIIRCDNFFYSHFIIIARK